LLLRAKRADLLRDALRGPNAEGRVYAALGLHQLDALAEADKKVVETLMNHNIQVNTCTGCKDGLVDYRAEYLIDMIFPSKEPKR
jgi:hypothetical protein